MSDAKTARDALRRAFNFGQTYWQQADSESFAANRRSVETMDKFNAFVEEAVAALRDQPPSVPQGWVRLADSDWVNIVDAPSVLDPMKDKEEAVREAVRLTEAKLRLLNAAPATPSAPSSSQQGEVASLSADLQKAARILDGKNGDWIPAKEAERLAKVLRRLASLESAKSGEVGK